MTKLQEFLIALGGNQSEDQEKMIEIMDMTLVELRRSGLVVSAISRYFRTPSFPKGTDPDFVNAAARLVFAGTARELLDRLHLVENTFGRVRLQRWGTRSLDLDLIAAGDLVLPDAITHRHWRDLPLDDQKRRAPDELILPHPRLQDRAFVLVPLADIAPDWVHPLIGKSVTEMLAALPEKEILEVVPL